MIVDRLGQEIQLGDRVLYPSHAPVKSLTGTVNYKSETAIKIRPDQISTWITDKNVCIRDEFRSPEVCLVLNENDPRVTLFLLENSVS